MRLKGLAYQWCFVISVRPLEGSQIFFHDEKVWRWNFLRFTLASVKTLCRFSVQEWQDISTGVCIKGKLFRIRRRAEAEKCGAAVELPQVPWFKY